MKFKHDFKTTLPYVSMQTAYDVTLCEAENVVMDTTIAVDPNHHYGGWYETYDVETGGDYFHAEGILEIYWDDNGDSWGTMGASSSLTTSSKLSKRRA